MSTRSELETLVRLAPEVDTTTLSDADLRTLLDKATVNLVAEQQEYVVSGATSLIDDDDFLAIDLRGGGVQFNDTARWIAEPEFQPKTKEWLDKNRVDWRSRSSTTSPLFWYLDSGEETENLVIGLVDKPDANGTNLLWIHYLGRGVLMTAATHFPWTGSTTQLVHLEPYEVLLVYYVLEWYNRLIAKNDGDADRYKLLYEAGAQAMASRLPLSEQLAREPFKSITPFSSMRRSGVRR